MGVPILSWPAGKRVRGFNGPRKAFFLASLVAAMTVAVSFAVLYENYHRLEDDGAEINLAGRQRMLAEHLGALTLQWVQADDGTGAARIETELAGTLQQLEESRRELLGESDDLPASLRRLYFDEPNAANLRLELMLARSRNLLNAGAEARDRSNPDFLFIEKHLPSLVGSLDRVARGYQRLYEQKLRQGMTYDGLLRLLTLLMVAGMAFLVFRPVNRSTAARRQSAEAVAIRDDDGAAGTPAPGLVAGKLHKRDEQLASLYLLGDRACHAGELSFATRSAAYGIFQALAARPVLIGELCDDGERFLPQVAIGVSRRLIPIDPRRIAHDSLPGRALRSQTPVHLSARMEPAWLEGMPYLADAAVASGIAAVIRDADGPQGLVMAFSDEIGHFNEDDLDFIQSVANLLGLHLDHAHVLAINGEPPLSVVKN